MALQIESFGFGRIIVGGTEYTSDVIIFPDQVFCPWWRKEGHEVCVEDVKKVIDFGPEVVIFGTGTSGLVKVLPSVIKLMEEKGIKIIREPTDRACPLYNEYCDKKKTVACLHLTC